jgi:hypothetical protein
MTMATLTSSKLLKYGAVCFIPMSSFDAVSTGSTYGGQTILLLEANDELPGYLGYFTLAGMPQPTMGSTDPGLGSIPI